MQCITVENTMINTGDRVKFKSQDLQYLPMNSHYSPSQTEFNKIYFTDKKTQHHSVNNLKASYAGQWNFGIINNATRKYKCTPLTKLLYMEGVWVALIWNDHSLKTAAVKIRTALSITVMAVIQTITLKSIAKHALKISQHRHADTAG